MPLKSIVQGQWQKSPGTAEGCLLTFDARLVRFGIASRRKKIV